jgi:hypothetical protein
MMAEMDQFHILQANNNHLLRPTILYASFSRIWQTTGHLSQSTRTQNKNLTSSNGQSPLPYLSSHNRFDLKSTIEYLKESLGSQTSPEITTGAHFLGFPIGSASFTNDYITKLFATFNNDLSKELTSQILDHQT